MQTFVRNRWWELLCFTLFLILVSYQIFVPPVTGLANNSDFVYVLGKLSICPVDRETQDKVYLVTDYFVDPVSCTFESGLTTSEYPIVVAATWLSSVFTGQKNFDLRALAALHLLILLIAFGVLLSITSRAGPAIRFGIPALFILIFSDVAYTAYLNSVYLDAPSFVLLLTLGAIGLAACLNHQSQKTIAAFLLFGVALVFTKSQHAILGLAFAAVALVLAFRPAKRLIRIEWAAIAVVLAGCTATMLSLTPSHYKLFALYNVIFSRLTMHTSSPLEVLHDVGLSEKELQYVTSHAYRPEAPVYNDKWSEDFLKRATFGKLIRYYLENPDVAFYEMDLDLHRAAPVLRPKDMANFRQKDGYPPATMATRFSLWSDLRSAALTTIPYHVLILFLAPWFVWLASWKWKALRWPVMPLALALSAGGMVEFAMSSLTDALDNARHLFLFQVLTEMMILMTAAGVLQLVGRRRAPVSVAAPAVQRKFALKFTFEPVAQLKYWRWELGFLALFVALVGYQIFLPPVTGLANNSDFMKALGPWSICSDHQPQNKRWLVTHYLVDPAACQYDLGITTLERPLVGVAVVLSSLFLGSGVFDLRFLAALHLAILALGFALVLRLTRRATPAIRFGIPAFFILIFSDVAYTCYLNSAYMDAPAFVLLIVASAVALTACFNHRTWLIAIAYLLAGAALVFSKSQHSVLGFFFALVALVFAWRSTTRGQRVRWIAVAVLLIGSMATMLAVTPSSYQLFALYSLIFHRLGPHSDNARQMLEELGLGEDDRQYLGTHSYTPGAPIYTALWAEEFLRRTSFSDVFLYYLKHPTVPIKEMNHDLQVSAPVMRPKDMPNFREEDGIPAGTLATRFSLWSSLRSFLLRVFPYHVFLFYLAPWVVLVAAWRYKMAELKWPVMPFALALSAAGMLEFAMASLTDALDIARHLFMFHVITELLILLSAGGLLSVWRQRADRPIREDAKQLEHSEVGRV